MDPYSPAIAYTHFGFLFHNALVQQVWPFSPAKGPAFEPYLATQYTRSEDGAEWTFTLRQGVTFNDGEAFKADDVVATVERFLDQDFRIHSQAAGLKLVFKGVSEIDDHTVVLDTGAPDSTAFAWLSSPMTPILLEHQIRGDLTAPDVQGRWKYLGPAPSKWSRGTPRGETVGVRNPNHFKFDESGNRLPYVDEVRFKWLPGLARRSAEFTAGDVHGAGGAASVRLDQANELCAQSDDSACYSVAGPHGFFAVALDAGSTPQFREAKVVQRPQPPGHGLRTGKRLCRMAKLLVDRPGRVPVRTLVHRRPGLPDQPRGPGLRNRYLGTRLVTPRRQALLRLGRPQELDRQYREVIRIRGDDAERAEGFRALERAYAKETLHVFPQGYTQGYVAVHGCVKNYQPGGLSSSPSWAHERTWLTAPCREG